MKKLLLVLLSVLVVLTLAGCASGGSGESEGGGEEAKPLRIGIIQFAPHVALDAATNGFTEVVKAAFPDADIDLKNAAGDIATCYSNADKAEKELGWKAENGIREMCEDSWRWQSKNPNGYLS